MNIKVKKLYENSIIPTFGSKLSAGADLYAHLCDRDRIEIGQHETEMIGTGIALAIPEGFWGGVYARSGLASKEGLRPANCVGVIDADYRGEIVVAIHNDCDVPKIIFNGDRIAQLVITPVPNVTLTVAEELDETERGEGGFGHTGK